MDGVGDVMKNEMGRVLENGLKSSDAILVMCVSIVASVAVYAIQNGYDGEFKLGEQVYIKLNANKTKESVIC